jgi:hypothetical protein
LSLLPSQASELVEAAAVRVYPPDSAESNDESYTSGEAAADASWLWDFQDDDHLASTATSAQGETVSPASTRLTRGLVARVFALPSSLIKRTRDPHIAVTKDDVVLFPVVGCRLVPEYSYLREDVAADDIDVHDHLQIDNKDRDASAPRKKKVVHVRSLPTVSNPSCRIRNFRDEELVGWYRKSPQKQVEGDMDSSTG